ncbi:MAG TPA: molybdopterin-dependent oxidoreductase [Spirochaetota bacterium]|nr:molybdopterin-dependent oxidoreductase [Spirochaetota bacterium]HPI88725.1 molybdopterin-dependent oxidoreductase [Spirochaetota bacterium]HPR48753.1 molybdopterin-dependent oxidoreductase [Spirochaetota bacterium]
MKKIERKDFLLMGGGALAGGLTGYVFSGAPFLSFQWLVEWTQDQYVPTKGEEKYLQKLCEYCPNKCEISVRMIGDRAVKVETSNSCCPLGQTTLQLLYHPERIQAPLKRTGSKGSGKFSPVSWDVALKEISEKVNNLTKENKSDLIASISKKYCLTSELVARMVKATGSANTYYETSEKSIAIGALGGFAAYDFEKSDLVLSFGAKLFEGWGNQCQMNKAFLAMKNNGTKIVQIDTNCSTTTSLADEWVAVKPGTEAILALGMANYLIKERGLTSYAQNFAAWAQTVINQYPLPKVSQLTGVDVKKIKELADLLAKAKNPIAVAGKGAKSVSSSSVEMQAVYGLNTLVKSKAVSLKAPSGLSDVPVKGKAAAGIEDFIKNKDFEVLFVNEANPVYKSVLGKELSEKMKNAFVVSIMPLINDTGLYSDYILPSISVLEGADSNNSSIAEPYGKAMHAGDIIIEMAKKINAAAGSFPWSSYLETINTAGQTKDVTSGFAFNPQVIKNYLNEYDKLMGSTEFPMTLLPIELPFIGDGDGLAFPYVLKTIDKFTYSGGKLWVQINRESADKYGISEGESLDIISERGEIGSVYAHLTDIVAPDVVGIPLGFGQKAYTKYAKDKGVNAKEIMSDKLDPLSGSANWWTTRVKIS